MARSKKDQEQLVGVLISPDNKVKLVPSGSTLYRQIAIAAIGSNSGLSDAFTRRYNPISDSGWGQKKRQTAYQSIVGPGTKSVRDLLVPPEWDFDLILDRIDFYRKIFPWINRALVLRAGINASEFSSTAPNRPDQTEWMLDTQRSLTFFSFIREFFWQLRAHNQAMVLWKTSPDGSKPLSIECVDLKIHQPRGPGVVPRVVVLPHKDEKLKKLITDATGSGDRAAYAKTQLQLYPAPLIDAVKKGAQVEVPAEILRPYGYRFEYAALDRRHYEDWAFPGMYTIFPDLEIVGVAQETDINALHHYKAGFILVRLGPRSPSGGDLPIMAGEPQLKELEKTILTQARNRLPTLVGRGDLSIDWVVPPVEILSPTKYDAAMRRIFDWLGIPKIAWAGQDFQGAFAAAQTTLKFIQQESKDERDIARELFERWLFERARESNKFKDAVWPRIRFDPNAMMEPRLIYEWARLFMQLGGASEETILEMGDLDIEVEAARRKNVKELKKTYKVDFDPEFITQAKTSRPTGRPATVSQPTPETGIQPQPRPSKSRGIEEDLVVT